MAIIGILLRTWYRSMITLEPILIGLKLDRFKLPATDGKMSEVLFTSHNLKQLMANLTISLSLNILQQDGSDIATKNTVTTVQDKWISAGNTMLTTITSYTMPPMMLLLVTMSIPICLF